MLKIFFCDSPLDINLSKFISSPRGVFEDRQEPGWILADPFKDIISDIDNSDIIMDGVLFQRRYKVHYPPEKLAGGTQMLLLMYHLCGEYLIFDLTACGPNCAKWLPSISSDRDIIARVGYPMPICPTEEWPVLCMNNNEIMKSIEDYKRCKSEYCYSHAETVVFPEEYCGEYMC